MAPRKSKAAPTPAQAAAPSTGHGGGLGGGDVEDNQQRNHPQDDADEDLVRKALREIVQDMSAPAAARAGAARTLAEIAGLLGKHSKAPAGAAAPVSTMTREQMEAELRGLAR